MNQSFVYFLPYITSGQFEKQFVGVDISSFFSASRDYIYIDISDMLWEGRM